MNKITSVHLNGKAYQLEETGFDALQAYLAQAQAGLAENPDKAEIMSDLEQAIGEKCAKFLSPHKDVVTAAEVSQIIAEMGPVGAPETHAGEEKKAAQPTHKKLYLIREGAILAGVCMGLAAYFDMDVTVVRIIFAVLTILTGGAWIGVYVAMALIIPYANTGEEKAAARGETFSAQDIVDRAKDRFQESYERFTGGKWDALGRAHRNHHQWKQEMREKKQQWKYEMRMRQHPSPFLGFVSGFLGLLWIFALLSLITKGTLFGLAIPAGVPLWVAIVILFIAYHAVTGPMKAARHGYYGGWAGFEDSLGILFFFIAAWFAYSHYPAVHDFINALPQEIHQWIDTVLHR